MAFTSYGTVAGLAVKHDFYRDLELEMQQENLNRKAQTDAENRAMLLGDMFRSGKANNPYDQSRLKDHVHKTVEEIGKIMRNNPNWRTDPAIWMQLREKSDSLLDNEWTQRSMRYDAETKRMQDALAKDPTIANRKAFKEQLQAAKNYAEFGSADGTETNRKEFQFIQPEGFKDLTEEAIKLGNMYGDFERIALEGNEYGAGAFEERPRQESFQALAHGFYMRNKEQIDQESAGKGVAPEEYAVKLIQSGLKAKREPGDYRLKLEQMKLAAKAKGNNAFGQPTGIWDRDIATQSVGYISPEISNKLFGNTAPVIAQSQKAGDPFINLGNRTVKWGDMFRTINDQKGNKLKVVDGEIEMSPEEAEQFGIYDTDFINEIEDEWSNLARIAKDTKTGKKDMVFVKVMYPFDDGSTSGNRSLATSYESIMGVPAEQKTLGYGTTDVIQAKLSDEIIISQDGENWYYQSSGKKVEE